MPWTVEHHAVPAIDARPQTGGDGNGGTASPAAGESAVRDADVRDELAGLDALELADDGPSRGRRVWSNVWPKLAALVLGLAFWQTVVWLEWKPDYLLPGPGPVFSRLGELIGDGTAFDALEITMQRAFAGFALAVLIGVVVGSLVVTIRPLRVAVGSLITGIQTMPSIAWFPLALLLFKISEGAIMFVVVLGAAPSIANGLITGFDHTPPILLRAGRVLGARGLSSYRHVVLPAALPGFVGGLKQGWAFAWRSLMAGELLVVIAGQPSVGFLLQNYRNLNDADGLMAIMILILAVGIAIDTLLFGTLDRVIRRRWGLLDPATN
jgi:sulfonate transport system permease protein